MITVDTTKDEKMQIIIYKGVRINQNIWYYGSSQQNVKLAEL